MWSKAMTWGGTRTSSNRSTSSSSPKPCAPSAFTGCCSTIRRGSEAGPGHQEGNACGPANSPASGADPGGRRQRCRADVRRRVVVRHFPQGGGRRPQWGGRVGRAPGRGGRRRGAACRRTPRPAVGRPQPNHRRAAASDGHRCRHRRDGLPPGRAAGPGRRRHVRRQARRPDRPRRRQRERRRGNMSQPLRVLILEDNPADVELSVHALRQAGYDVEWIHVDDRDGFAAHLNDAIDVILADYALPQFNAGQALQMAQERGLDVPFLVVSGTIGEELAVEMMKQGGGGYPLKDRLARLGTAVGTALEQRRLRKERADIEEALHSQDRLFRAVVEHASDGIALVRQDMTIAYLSPATELLGKYDSSELTGSNAPPIFLIQNLHR